MRITNIALDTAGLPSQIAIAPPISHDSGNWITVITGENGVRKSFLLRLIAHAAQGKSHLTDTRYPPAWAALVPKAIVPIHTIAISGTPQDRFPSTAGIPIARKVSQFDVEEFNFFGSRNSATPSSRSPGLAALVHSLLQAPIKGKRRKAAAAIFGRLGYLPRIHVTLVSVGTPRSQIKTQGSQREAVIKQARVVQMRIRQQRDQPLARFLDGLLNDEESLLAILEKIQRPLRLDWDFNKVPAHESYEANDSQLLRHLLKAGIVSVDTMELELTPDESSLYQIDQTIPSLQLSSGQWQFLYSLLHMTMKIRQDSLILIDEPENSLHPEWQREYISALRDVMAITNGVHAIVVTHSPLIASGVQAEEGNQLRLERGEGGIVRVIEEDAVFGWLPDDVMQHRFNMESARAPEIEELADLALAHLKHPYGQRSDTFRTSVRRLVELTKGLPSSDPLIAVVEALQSYLPKVRRSKPRRTDA